jgi:hypothetical protein
MTEADTRAEGRREAAPAAFTAFVVIVVLALVTWRREWDLLGLPWWVWLLIALPALLLTIDLTLAYRGGGLVRSRRAAIVLLGMLVLGNLAALVILVAGLVTERRSDLGGGELLGTAFAIYTTNLIVFGLLFWELEAGGPGARRLASTRVARDFAFPQDDRGVTAEDWRPSAWDYLYVSATNSIAFSPTDAMPLTIRAKAAMALEAFIGATIILLVTARAVNVLGS